MMTPTHAGKTRGGNVGGTINVEPVTISHRRNLQKLDYIGENKDSYGECEGDCDDDSDCEVSLNITYRFRIHPSKL